MTMMSREHTFLADAMIDTAVQHRASKAGVVYGLVAVAQAINGVAAAIRESNRDTGIVR